MKAILICLILVSSASAALPSFFRTCNRNDPNFGKCFTETGNEVLKTFVKGIPELQIPVLTPTVSHPILKYKPDDKLFLEIDNIHIYGMDRLQIVESQGNFKDKTLTIKMKFNSVGSRGTYRMKALKENDESSGRYNFTAPDSLYEAKMHFDVKDNQIVIISLNVDFHGVRNPIYNFENIDQHPAVKTVWGKNGDNFFTVCIKVFEKMLTRYFGQVFKSATYNEIFPPK